jgi:hypothetical protein
MKKSLLALLLAVPCFLFPVPCFSQTVPIAATYVQDGNSLACPTGTAGVCTIAWVPVLSGGTPTVYHKPSGGIATASPVTTFVVNGAFSLASMPDSAYTTPLNLCWRVTLNTPNGSSLLGSCVQPSASNYWYSAGVDNFDNWLPSIAPLPTIAYVQSVNGCAGVCTVNGGNGSMTWPTYVGLTAYNGSGWTTPTAAMIESVLGFAPLNPANNLSDVASSATARTNLGLGSAAQQAASYFQTALGYAPLNPADNLSDVASAATARTNLGLGSAAQQAASYFQTALGYAPLNPANNLSDVASAATARTNLGLGTAAQQATSAFDAAGAAATAQSNAEAAAVGGVLSGNLPNPGLSSTPHALPNGWTATTQTTGDNTTDVATDAFVLANAANSVYTGAVYVSPACGGQANCYTIHDDVQVAMNTTYPAGGTGGSTATLVTTSADLYGQWLNVTTPTSYFGGYETMGTAYLSTTFGLAFKVATTGNVINSWGSAVATGSATTVTLAVTPTGGSGHILVVCGRHDTASTLPTYTFTDNSGSNTYTPVTASPITVGYSSYLSQGCAYVPNVAGGSYTITLTYSITTYDRSLVAYELSGMATSSPLDAYSTSVTTVAGTVVTMQTMTTSASDLVLQVSTMAHNADTVTAGKIGTLSYVTNYTTGTSGGPADPAFASTDVGKKILGTADCDEGNGYIDCYTEFPAGTTIVAYVSPTSVQLSTLPIFAQATTIYTFTGWFLWGHDDGAQINAAWNAAAALPGYSLVLPCGVMFTAIPPFLSTSAGAVFNPNINGCSSGGSAIVPTPDFNYSLTSGGVIYSYANTNQAGYKPQGAQGNLYQNPWVYSQLSNFSIWGAGQDGSFVSNTLPVLNMYNTVVQNVWILGWDWNTPTTFPCMSITGGVLDDAGGWAACTEGLLVAGDQSPTNIGNSARDCWFGAQANNPTPFHIGPGLVMQAGDFVSQNCTFNPGHVGYATTDEGATMAGGTWVSTGDFAGGIHIGGGQAIFLNTKDAILSNYGVYITGGSLSAQHSQIDFLNMTAGTFYDLGDNYTCTTVNNWQSCGSGVAGPWTINQHALTSITGGVVVGSASSAGTAQTAANITASTGWGTSGAAGNGISAVSGGSHRAQFTITAAGTPGSDPNVALTFPVPFAVAPFCQAQQVGGTGSVGAFTSGTTTTTSTGPFTWWGTPAAGSTYIVLVTCEVPGQ